jgi:uncharacterized protein (TIGR03032 family)
VSLLMRTFDQAMGIAVDATSLAVGTRWQVWILRNAPDIAAQLEPRGHYDGCFLPRMAYVTGDIRVHEMAWGSDALWLVNTRFSCLCTPESDYSFVPRWRPPFVSDFVAEDRCHLNGLALVDGVPKYVTALGRSNSPEGWREQKATGGIVIDVPSGEIIAHGLCMPHSPRVHQGRLYVLDSGTGRLITVDVKSGVTETVTQLPGYARGVALHGGYAFVGLSQIRETSMFGGLPITETPQPLRCGVWAIELESGRIAAFAEFQSGVQEVFDVQIVPGVRFPAVIGIEKDDLMNVFVVPPN